MIFVTDLFTLLEELTWGWSLIPLLVIFGLSITAVSGFAQFRFFGRMFRVLRPGKQLDGSGAVSARQALLLSVGGRVGGGNIAGVAVAVTLGGPGAVFWMWAVALIGMATSLVECTLAQVYKRREPDGTFRGGPATSIMHGLGSDFRWLAILYAVCLVLASLGFVAFQANTAAAAVDESFGLDRKWTAIVLAIFTGAIVFGGIKRIAKTADVIVPSMAFGYMTIALIVVGMNITEVPALLYSIVANAFGLEEAVGGGMGAALAQGLRRGLFSNEAGLGTAPNIAATANVRHPVSQGITQSFSVFIDTMVVCTCTALIILLSEVYVPGGSIDGAALAQRSLASHLGGWATYLLAFMLLLFTISSIIYLYYLGENGLAFLFRQPLAVKGLRLAIIGIVFLGALATSAVEVLFYADTLMGVLAVVNLIAIMMLLPTCLTVIKDYRAQLRAGVDSPALNPDDFPHLDIDHSAWTYAKERKTPALSGEADQTMRPVAAAAPLNP